MIMSQYWTRHTPSAAYTTYSIHCKQQTPSIVYLEYSIHRVQHTPSTAYTEYSIHRLLHTQSTAYTKYHKHQVQHTPSTGYTEYSILDLQHTSSTAYLTCTIHRIQHTPSQAYPEYSKHRVQHTLRTASTEYSIHWVQHTPSTTYMKYRIHRAQHIPSTAYTQYSIHRVRNGSRQPASSPGNLPAVQVSLAKQCRFGSRPVQHPALLTLGGLNLDPYLSICWFCWVWLVPSVLIAGFMFRVWHLWSHSDSLLWIVKYWDWYVTVHYECIGCLNDRNENTQVDYRILKMNVNGASMIVGRVCWII
jgi:hypothetical protein